MKKKNVLKLLNSISRWPILKYLPTTIFRIYRITNRFSFAYSYYKNNINLLIKWSFKDTEDSNFYYQLTPLNVLHLTSMLTLVTGIQTNEVKKYINEIENDFEWKNHININLKKSNYGKDTTVEFGRRIGWYVIARALKPKIVVETGVYHGVGSVLLTAALLRNKSEGFTGFYYGTDIDLNAGKLLCGEYASIGKILYGDSLDSLKKLNQQIDLFINDSDHSESYEKSEYDAVEHLLSENSILLGDNSHVTSALEKFSQKTNRSFLFFKEIPQNHWYPGAGIGISFKKKWLA